MNNAVWLDIQNFFAKYTLKIITVLIIFIIGIYLIRYIIKLLKLTIDKSPIDETLKPFILSLTNVGLKVILVLIIIEIMGIEATSLTAIIGASSFAIGLAFQGSLANFAGGILILCLKPFGVGDFIEAQGQSGIVEAINVFNTRLVTVDNKVISIPNGGLSNATVTNYNLKETRRVDINFGVGYEQDIDKVKSVLTKICNSHELILKQPEPFIRLIEQGDSAIVFVVRVWTKTSDYWNVYFDLMETVKKRFDEENISIPYPQMDIHMEK